MRSLAWFYQLLFLLCCPLNAVVDAGERLQVVFVGKYRSGSTSIATALRRLGYNPCHGREVVDNIVGSHAKLADAFIAKNITEILQATSDLGCNATMEMHAIFFKDIAARVKGAKFIVVRRPKDAWMKSLVNFRIAIAPINRFPLRWIPRYGKLSKLFSTFVMTEGGLDTRELALQVMTNPSRTLLIESMERVYNSFVDDSDELLRSFPKNSLLFDLQQGYPPLCKFLGIVDCPQETFPHVHSAVDVMAKYSVPRKLELIINGILLAFSFLLTVVVLKLQPTRKIRSPNKME
jgi:hypothetical protein